MLTLTVNMSSLTFANALRIRQTFKTGGGLCSKSEFSGFGEYKPFDQSELDEIRDAAYVVYSYDTPIAWASRDGVWFENATKYSATTSKHQSKIFAAINELS